MGAHWLQLRISRKHLPDYSIDDAKTTSKVIFPPFYYFIHFVNYTTYYLLLYSFLSFSCNCHYEYPCKAPSANAGTTPKYFLRVLVHGLPKKTTINPASVALCKEILFVLHRKDSLIDGLLLYPEYGSVTELTRACFEK